LSRSSTEGSKRAHRRRLSAAGILSLASGILSVAFLFPAAVRMWQADWGPELDAGDFLRILLLLVAAGLALLLARAVRREAQHAGVSRPTRLAAALGQRLGALALLLFLAGSVTLAAISGQPDSVVEDAKEEIIATLHEVWPWGRGEEAAGADLEEPASPEEPPALQRAREPATGTRADAFAADLRAGEPEVRRRAVSALAGIGTDAVRDPAALVAAAPALVEALGQEDLGWQAARALERIGAAAVPPLREGLESGELPLSHDVVWLIEMLGPTAAPLAPALVARLERADRRSVHYLERALAALGPTAVGPLVEALGREEAEVRRRAAEILGRMGQEAEAGASALLARLGDEDAGVRSAVEHALSNMGRAAEPSLLSRLSSTDPKQRAEAARMLGRSGGRSPAVAKALLSALEDPVPAVRSAAVQSLGWVVGGRRSRRLPRGVPPRSAGREPTGGKVDLGEVAAALTKRLREDGDPQVRGKAAGALGRFGRGYLLPASSRPLLSVPSPGEVPRGSVAALVEALRNDPARSVRRSAAGALASLEPDLEMVEGALIEALRDPSLVSWAAAALERYGPEAGKAVPALIEVMEGADRQTCPSLASALAAMKDKALAPLIDALEKGPLPQRRCAAVTLGKLGADGQGAQGVPALARSLSDPDPEMRRLSAGALATMGDAAREAVPALLEAVRDPDWQVRWFAATALGTARGEDPRVLAALVRALEDKDPRVRGVAAGSLWSMGAGAAAAVPALLEALRDGRLPSGVVYRALGGIGPPAAEAVPELISALGAGEPGVPRESLEALTRIGSAAIPALLREIGGGGESEEREVYARRALAGIGAEAVPLLGNALGDPDPCRRAAIVDVLGRIGPPAREAVPALEELLEDPDPAVCAKASRALSRILPGRRIEERERECLGAGTR